MAKKNIKSFSSFTEMENEQIIYYAGLTVEELFRNLKLLNLAAFGFNSESDLRKPDKKIKFNF